MAFIRWIIGLVICTAITAFAVLNRSVVSVSYSPVTDPLMIPLYVIILGCLAVGFVLGGSVVWINESKIRKERRAQKKELKVLEKENNALKETRFAAPPAQELFSSVPVLKIK